jgi:hypothetical protein
MFKGVNAQCNVAFILIYSPQLGVINEKRCKSIHKIDSKGVIYMYYTNTLDHPYNEFYSKIEEIRHMYYSQE